VLELSWNTKLNARPRKDLKFYDLIIGLQPFYEKKRRKKEKKIRLETEERKGRETSSNVTIHQRHQSDISERRHQAEEKRKVKEGFSERMALVPEE